MISDELWEEWIAAQRRCFRLVTKREFSAALGEIDAFLHHSAIQGEAYAFRSLVKEKMGDISGTQNDLLAAHDLSSRATYQRYAIELTLGRLSEERQDIQAASSWYFRAMQTASEDKLTSGASAVEGLLGTKDRSSWSSGEVASCEKVVKQAWELFSLPGAPDFSELKRTLRILAEASTHPLPMARPNK